MTCSKDVECVTRDAAWWPRRRPRFRDFRRSRTGDAAHRGWSATQVRRPLAHSPRIERYWRGNDPNPGMCCNRRRAHIAAAPAKRRRMAQGDGLMATSAQRRNRMDGKTFDSLLKLTATSTGRRRLFETAAAAGVGSLLTRGVAGAVSDVVAEACENRGKKCN